MAEQESYTPRGGARPAARAALPRPTVGAPNGATAAHAKAPPLRLHSAHRSRIEQLARGGYPHETCGLLVGREHAGRVHVDRVTHARNLSTERLADRYRLDPDDYLAADEEARRDGLEIVGVWHSHPDHPALPSATDLRSAWPEYTYVIVEVRHGKPADLTAWRLEAADFVEQTIEEEL